MENLVFPIIESFLLTTFLYIVFDMSIKENVNKYLLNLIAIIFINILIDLFLNDAFSPYKTLVYLTFQIFAFYFCTHKRFWQVSVYTCLGLAMFTICQAFIVLLLQINIERANEYMYTARVGTYLLFLILNMFFYIYKNKLPTRYTENRKSIILITTSAFLAIISIFINVFSFMQDYKLFVFSICNIVFSIAYIVIVFMTFKQQETIINKEYYIKNAENALYMLRRQKHNFDNILNTITGLISLQRYDELEMFLGEVNKVTKSLVKCRNLCVSALISQKVNDFSDGVNVELDLRSDLTDLNIPDYELCEIIGILMDNAYEASAHSENKFMEIQAFDNMSCTIVKISNSFRGEIQKEKLFTKGYSTKSADRGLGLFVVKSVMDKYNNDIDVNINDGLITFSLLIQKKRNTETAEEPMLQSATTNS